MNSKVTVIALVLFFFCKNMSFAQKDTLTVMAYNVMNYGKLPLCQGPINAYHSYLDTIIQFAKPDVLSLEKMGSVKFNATDVSYSAQLGFADSILNLALNASFPNKYAYCPFTNYTSADNMSILFYNQNKLGFVSIVCSYDNTTDFNTYKLYYKDPNLTTTHDTTFLYFTLNHDQSGSDPTIRNAQILGEMTTIGYHFKHLPNMLNMGDFNTKNTSEGCYQILTFPADTNFRFYEPAFYPDNVFTYPADFDSSPGSYAAFLTTSTRRYGNIPNTCGTNGGAKGWYDHIFISPWILNNANYVHYIPHSYKAFGNDGSRLGFSVNDVSPTINTSAPANVLNALFQMSDKYPVMVNLEVTMNTTGTGPADPEVPVGVGVNELKADEEHVSVVNPITNELVMSISSGLINNDIFVECFDVYGHIIYKQSLYVDKDIMKLPFQYKAGTYFVKIYSRQQLLYHGAVIKQ